MQFSTQCFRLFSHQLCLYFSYEKCLLSQDPFEEDYSFSWLGEVPLVAWFSLGPAGKTVPKIMMVGGRRRLQIINRF